MQKFVLVLIALMLLQWSEAEAQRSAESSLLNFSRSSGTYSFDIHARRTNGGTSSILVGMCSFFVNYNSAALSSPTLTNVNSRFSGPPDHTGDYDPMTIQILAGRIAVTVWFTGNSTGFGNVLSRDGEWVCTVNLTVVDPTAATNVSFDNSNSAISDIRGVPVVNSFMESENTLLAVQPALPATRESAPPIFALHQNYPNPFNPATTIRFSVEKTARATLDIYNILGQQMSRLYDAIAEAGVYHKVRFEAMNFASGTYIYRLESGGKSQVRKLLLLK